jgi:hypothetical protein
VGVRLQHGRPTGQVGFRLLLGAHVPSDPAEATLVLAAAAAINGLKADGSPMDQGAGHRPSLSELAAELQLSRSAVRRGVQHLLSTDAITMDRGRIRVDPRVLAERWAVHRQRIRITCEVRQLRMRPRSLLLTALVAGQAGRDGRLRLGVQFLAERTGFPRRSLERALANARKEGALHTWSQPPSWILYLAVGPAATEQRAEDICERHETAVATVTNRRSICHETAVDLSRNGARHPDPSGVPDSPPECPASPAGETRPAANRKLGVQQLVPRRGDEIRGIVEDWVRKHGNQWCLTAPNSSDVSSVATLIDAISPRPAAINDPPAFFRERLGLAKAVIRWCPSPERLGRWIVRARRWFGVHNLGAYLRTACERGDPGTLLESHSKNRLGRATETWTDFTKKTEEALKGPHADNVAALVEGLAGSVRVVDERDRARLREQLSQYVSQRRPVAARKVLRKLIPVGCSDGELKQAIDGILPLPLARQLLEAA